MNKPVYTLDGSQFSSLGEFAKYFSAVVLKEYQWDGNLDTFNDILRGDFGTPEGGFILRWESSDRSRAQLGYAETVKWLEQRLPTCHPSNLPRFQEWLNLARQGQGKTVFDMIVEIISAHGSGGDEAEDGVELYLL